MRRIGTSISEILLTIPPEHRLWALIAILVAAVLGLRW
jgi:hypothetical protein